LVEIINEFIVKEDARGHFELAYGPGGAWSNLFGRSSGFRGTTVLCDTENPRRYLIIDLWDTVEQRDQALKERKSDYSDVQDTFNEWTESKADLGIFSVRAEATVRPRSRTGQRKSGASRRSSHRTTL
jgi:hypothetical protein